MQIRRYDFEKRDIRQRQWSHWLQCQFGDFDVLHTDVFQRTEEEKEYVSTTTRDHDVLWLTPTRSRIELLDVW